MYLTRHSDMIKDIDMNIKITIVGAGSIGSYTCLALAKLGFTNIYVFDDGIIEEENIAPQFFRPRDIGKAKVFALKEMIRQQTGTEIIAANARVGVETSEVAAPLIICAVDSMEARDMIHNFAFNHFIDARMAIEFLTVIAYKHTAQNKSLYKRTLFSDEAAVQEACTNKAISFTSLIAGGLVAKTALNCLKGEVGKLTTVNFDINAFDMVRL